jgi:crotonobetainyl-CoA:carnitine CoA-transferase CaiB-like acyl-CoA transferase
VSPIAPALRELGDRVAELTASFGQRVDPQTLGISDRAGLLQLDAPGRVSANRACHLIRTADGWIAANLAREEDRELVPAWLRGEAGDDPWPAIHRTAQARTCDDLLADAILLGLPVSRLGEAAPGQAPRLQLGLPAVRRRALRVLDLSALWAGPMCGAVLAAMGAEVIKVESLARPDPTRVTMPAFFERLNGRKTELRFDFATPDGCDQLREAFADASIVITSARPRAFVGLGLPPEVVFSFNSSLVWVAITGHGWSGAAAERVAFGDDAAAAGGLVRWTAGGEPHFLGDALADPVTGLSAAIGALEALGQGGGWVVDVAMARCAANATALCAT